MDALDRLADFIEVDGIFCIYVTDEAEGQSVKSDIGIRTIPIHPKLIRLGLPKRVESLRKMSWQQWESQRRESWVPTVSGRLSLKGHRLWLRLPNFELPMWDMSWTMNAMLRIAGGQS